MKIKRPNKSKDNEINIKLIDIIKKHVTGIESEISELRIYDLSVVAITTKQEMIKACVSVDDACKRNPIINGNNVLIIHYGGNFERRCIVQK